MRPYLFVSVKKIQIHLQKVTPKVNKSANFSNPEFTGINDISCIDEQKTRFR